MVTRLRLSSAALAYPSPASPRALPTPASSGDREAEDGGVHLKPLRGEGEQATVAMGGADRKHQRGALTADAGAVVSTVGANHSPTHGFSTRSGEG